jgi:TfoX/Sxy family transcriptional regulator of competence genes
MAWKKNSPDAVQRFDELVAVRGASRKVMFGCPVYALGGQRYAILHQNRVVLRLAPKDAAQLIAKGGRPFEPFKGRPVKDRVTVPESIAANSRSLRGWVRRAVRHARETVRGT